VKYVGPILGILFFAGLFVLIGWLFEVNGLHMLVLQHRAESFPVVRGKVLSVEVTTTSGRRGGTYYHPSFFYSYEVVGQEYHGWRYRYDGDPSFLGSASAERLVRAHPAGSEIEVHYNPMDPRDALLSPGVQGDDIGNLFMGFPLCLFMLYGMITAGREITALNRSLAIAGGVKILSEGTITRVRLPDRDPWSWCLVTMGVLSFVAAIVIAANKNMGLQIAGMIALLIVIAGAAVYLWLWRKIFSGAKDLVIDEAARTLRLPLNYGRREEMGCAFSEVTGVSLKKMAHKGRRSRVTYTYAPILLMAGKEPQQLADLSRKRAESFAAWLREKLGLVAEARATLVEK
jgi:hypothetical protein